MAKVHEVDVFIQLNAEQFKGISIWNMFCRKKMMVVFLTIVYVLGISSILSAIPAIPVNINTFILSAGMGALMVGMACYLVYSNVSRFNRFAKNEEQLQKTRKHVRINEYQICNYRLSVDDEVTYKWDQVEGFYYWENHIVICMKDGQILALNKEKLTEQEIAFLDDQAITMNLQKKSLPLKSILAVEGVLTVGFLLTAAYLLLTTFGVLGV